MAKEAASRRRRRVLLVSYLFPPTGGSGVQRNLKFVKYLPEFGWDPIVLSVKDILYFDHDASLLREVPAGTTVIRTGSADVLRLAYLATGGRPSGDGAAPARVREGSMPVRAYRAVRRAVLFPDAQVGWIPFAYRRGLRAIREHGIDVIVGSVQPVSAAIVARMLSRKTGVPYVLDFRDGWTDDPYLEMATGLHARSHAALERRTLSSASAMTVFGEALAHRLSLRYPGLKQSIGVLHNGFDPADFIGLPPVGAAPDRFRLSYVGTLQPYFRPNVRCLMAAIAMLPVHQQAKLDVQVIGQADGNLKALIAKETPSRIKFLGYMPHDKALSHLLASDASLLMLQVGDRASLTGKVFEYIGAGHPIVASVEPDGAVADLLRKAGHEDWIVPPEDAVRMAQVLAGLIESKGRAWNFPGAELFDRRRGAARLAAILDEVVDARSPATGGPG